MATVHQVIGLNGRQNMKFSQAFALDKIQAELDFVDVELNGDTPLYVDPFALSLRKDDWSMRCTRHIVSFFQSALTAIHNEDEQLAHSILSNLSEPNETRLGKSEGAPRGRGVSGKQSLDLYEALADSEAAKTGVLSEIAECDLFIEGIGPDKISDITTNIIRALLVEYTQAQCLLHGIATIEVPVGSFWDIETDSWTSVYAQLPVWNGTKILLVPKAIVRFRMSLDSQEYYNHFVLNFLQAEHIRAGSSLVKVFKKSKQPYVTKKSLKEIHPYSKTELYKFTKHHPEVLGLYKKLERKERTAQDDALDPDFNLSAFCDALSERLRAIPPGRTNANAFHSLMIGAIEFLFYPALMYPVKETPINEGRKRIDISYTNAARQGFFYGLHTARQVASNLVMVECKNYTDDLGNPEVDQLVGRFSINRGRFGILIARTCADRALMNSRCKDVAQAGNGFVVALFDEDILEMLTSIKARDFGAVDRKLDGMFRQGGLKFEVQHPASGFHCRTLPWEFEIRGRRAALC